MCFFLCWRTWIYIMQNTHCSWCNFIICLKTEHNFVCAHWLVQNVFHKLCFNKLELKLDTSRLFFFFTNIKMQINYKFHSEIFLNITKRLMAMISWTKTKKKSKTKLPLKKKGIHKKHEMMIWSKHGICVSFYFIFIFPQLLNITDGSFLKKAFMILGLDVSICVFNKKKYVWIQNIKKHIHRKWKPFSFEAVFQ